MCDKFDQRCNSFVTCMSFCVSEFRGARSDRNFIHVNLALAIGFAQITFLAGIDETGNKVG